MEVKKMETITKFAKKVIEKEFDQEYKDYVAEFSKGYLELESIAKQKQLIEYINAYDQLNDKESFHAQYLSVLIESIKLDK